MALAKTPVSSREVGFDVAKKPLLMRLGPLSMRRNKMMPAQQLLSASRARYCRGMVVRFALFMCVSILLLGRGVPPAYGGEAQDLRVEQGVTLYDAKTILLPLAEAGHPKAMHFIGRMHDGTTAFPTDHKVECDWYERAANAGYMTSMYNLSVCFNHGHGRAKDQEQMLHWRKKAANLGFIPAMINLAWRNQTEDEEYRYWMNMAAEHGSKYAHVDLWLGKYKSDVPDIEVRDIVCVSVRILIFDEDVLVCD